MELEDLRLAVYGQFATTGRAPTATELATRFDVPVSGVAEALSELASRRHLALDPTRSDDAGVARIALAHPFASIPMGFSVMGRETLWWGGCAWDSFALPQLVPDDPEVLVATTCPACAGPHAWVVGRDRPPPGDQVAHFLVPAAHMWDDVIHTCSHQRIFCDETCVGRWLDDSGLQRGYVMDLATLWRFAAHWYDGRLDRGYQRREPADAAAYLRSVGLEGPFWGL
jgi:alkylmercury lyase-like protein